MKMNRRDDSRLKIDRSVKVPVQLFPVMPFLGGFIEATLLNFSIGGMALMVDEDEEKKLFKRGQIIRMHFNLPGRTLQECRGKVLHRFLSSEGKVVLGLKFTKMTRAMKGLIKKIIKDNNDCERRIHQAGTPRCETSCAFYKLCRKPLRISELSVKTPHFEISFQNLDETIPV